MSNETQFPDGFRIFAPNDRAPEYILGDIVINVDTFTQYMRAAHAGGELRLTLKRSQKGNIYAQLNTWRPKKKEYQPQQAPPSPPPFPEPPQELSGLEPGDESIDNIPF